MYMYDLCLNEKVMIKEKKLINGLRIMPVKI